VKLCAEFDEAITTKKRMFGTLLSGPNGVGKSTIGLLTFLSQFSRGQPIL
jgi:ABC-type cobalamin/Fe3+-siderophores transport system ATPase subunit